MATVYEIVQGLAQAAANAYDGALGEDYEPAKPGILRREEGDALIDQRVMDGFNVKFYGDVMCISYQSDVKLKEVYAGGFEQEMERMINEIKKFLQKEYKAITGNSVRLTSPQDSEIKVLVQSTSRVRSFVQAYQHYKVSGLKEEPILDPKIEDSRSITRKFLEQFSDKRPQNDKRKKGDNQKK